MPTPASRDRSRRRIAGALITMVGVIVLVVGILTLRNSPDDAPGDNVAAETGISATTQTSSSATPRAGTTFSPQVVVLPVTVLNNSPGTMVGLASRVAAALAAGGWPIADTLDYNETQAPATTAYYTPGNVAEEAAARRLVSQFPQIAGGVQPRFEGLPGTGLTVAATGDWVP